MLLMTFDFGKNAADLEPSRFDGVDIINDVLLRGKFAPRVPRPPQPRPRFTLDSAAALVAGGPT